MAPSRTTSVRSEVADSTTPNAAGVSLLWGHQLKREHGYLLERMVKMETSNQALEARIRSAESAASALKEAAEDVHRLIEDKDEIDEARAAWIATAETRLGQLKESVERIRTVQPRVAELEGQVDSVEERVQGFVTGLERVRQQVKILEEEVQEKGREMEVLERRKDEGSVVRGLMQRLDAMEMKTKDEEKRRDALQSRIEQLERSLEGEKSTTKKRQRTERQVSVPAASSEFSLPAVPEEPTQLLPTACEVNTQIRHAPSEVATQVLPTGEEPTQLLGSGSISTQMLDNMMLDMPTQNANSEEPTQLLGFGDAPGQLMHGTSTLGYQESSTRPVLLVFRGLYFLLTSTQFPGCTARQFSCFCRSGTKGCQTFCPCQEECSTRVPFGDQKASCAEAIYHPRARSSHSWRGTPTGNSSESATCFEELAA